MQDAYVLTAARTLQQVYARAGSDKREIQKAMIALGVYAQRNCGEGTWWIRLEAIMLSS